MNNYGKKYFNTIKSEDFKIFVLTNFHKQYLKNVNFIDKEISVIPNIIDIPDITKDLNKSQYLLYAGIGIYSNLL